LKLGVALMLHLQEYYPGGIILFAGPAVLCKAMLPACLSCMCAAAAVRFVCFCTWQLTWL
jgi:hypothetical protein